MARILVADDDEICRGLLARVCEGMGHQVVSFVDGREARDYMKSGGRCDMIISDIVMPELSGAEFFSWLRSHPEFEDTPVLLVSGKVVESSVSELIESGAAQFLSKPIRTEELHRAIEEMLKPIVAND